MRISYFSSAYRAKNAAHRRCTEHHLLQAREERHDFYFQRHGYLKHKGGVHQFHGILVFSYRHVGFRSLFLSFKIVELTYPWQSENERSWKYRMHDLR